MTELATPGQLRMSYWRWALVTVPAIVLIGSLMGLLSNSGYDNRWFAALDRPAIVPPGWVFGVVWTALYACLGLSLAMILHARGATGRGFALLLFFVQLIASFAWSPLFFGQHQVTSALYLIIFILMVTVATAFAFAPMRKAAAWLLVPYMAWLSFATILNFQIDQRNPDAETLVPAAASTQIG
ncbi:TspO/MBR family protein [Sphingopyxis indica]|uniref:TspO and MBR related proteins n=1 Tax=Sphingopyxis indica TaxID=436663 RepID=A0A239GA01_9SPHN|nr:TspO/MBR family protein [Sphingopyxis indica]SNS65765.1 TspO and MBR related proteins [Sphingopyxis indica]